jgi:serine/threonine-protein kinase
MERVGKFEIVEELGRGGMGVVYKAIDPGIGRTVALKVLPPAGTQSPELRERFLREARAAGRLQHPNIVVIHEIGEDHGNLFIAMEYLEGETLAQRISREQGKPQVGDVLDIMAQVARGLSYAHERGVVHRDIKPANILVTMDGTAKILDFGIARAGDQRMTKTRPVMATIFYMSPEQINGQKIDGRSDLFSAGIVLNQKR